MPTKFALGLCTTEDVDVSTAPGEEVLLELDVLEDIRDPTSIVLVVVTICGEADVEAREGVIVVEAIGTETMKFAPFSGAAGPGSIVALGRVGGVGGKARASSGVMRIPEKAVPIPRMPRIYFGKGFRNATVAWVTTLLAILGATSTPSSEEWCMIERSRIRKEGWMKSGDQVIWRSTHYASFDGEGRTHIKDRWMQAHI